MNSKLLKKYIRNYLSVLVIVLVLLAPIYLSIYKETKERILTQKTNQLGREVNSLDNQISKMQFITDMLRSNNEIAKVATIKENPKAKDSILLNRAKEFLADCLILGGVEDIHDQEYLMFRDNSVIFTASRILSDSAHHDYSDFVPLGLKFETFKSLLFENNSIIQYIPYTDYEEVSYVYVSQTPVCEKVTGVAWQKP